MHFSKPCSGASHFHGNIYILYCDAHVIARSASSIELWRPRTLSCSLNLLGRALKVLYRLSATHSVCVLPDKKQRVPITWEFLPAFLAILPSYVLHCIQTCPTHTSGDGIGSDIIVCDTTRRCCVLPLTNARNTKETEREWRGELHAWNVNTCT